MPKLTNVNRLQLELNNATNKFHKAMTEAYGPRWPTNWHSRWGLQPQTQRGLAHFENMKALAVEADKKKAEAYKALQEALNQNKNSFQAQMREINRAIQALNSNKYKAQIAIRKLNKNYLEATTENERKRINNEKIPHRKVLARYKRDEEKIQAEKARLKANKAELEKGLKLRMSILTKPMTENRARTIIAKHLKETTVARTLTGPLGTRTLSPMRRWPNYQDPTLEKYAAAMRRINMLERLLEVRGQKRKRSPNSN